MKKKKTWLFILSLILLLSLCPAAYGGEDGNDPVDKTLAPYFLVEGADPSSDSFPLKDTKVSTTINGVIAETYVTQTYGNEGSVPVNASYVFPASTRVSVHGMKMQIGDKAVTARIKEKEEARQEFTAAKSQGKSASLLEQQRPNVFTMKVANIMPGDTVNIELHYTEMLVLTEGTYEFVFPAVVGPRYVSPSSDQKEGGHEWAAAPYQEKNAAPKGTYDIAVSLSTGVPITGLACASHKINVEQPVDSSARIALGDPADHGGDRDFILRWQLAGQAVKSGLMLNTGEKENFFMLMVQPPERVSAEDIPSREYIFVLDVSGSMFGYPLDTAKELIEDMVSNLRETDTFNLILFSNNAICMSPESLPATDKNVGQAIDLINRQKGGGGTELAPALKKAAGIPMDPRAGTVSRSIVVITDGYMSDEQAIFDIVSGNLDTTSFFSFGIGTSVNRYLIDGIARAGGGGSFVVTDPAEAADTARLFETYIHSPVLTDIHVDYDGFDVYDIEPTAIPTLFAQKPIVLFGKWRGRPAGAIHITGKSGTGDYSQTIQVSETAALGTNTAIPYLWARTRVENLMDYGFNGGDEEAVRKEVTALGLDYSMMTSYTSFVAVMDEVRNTTGEGRDVDQPLPLPLHVSDLAVGRGYTIGSEPDILLLAAAAALILILNIRNTTAGSSHAGGKNDG